MSNRAYWEKRAAARKKLVDREAAQAARAAREAYERALNHIDKELARWYQQFADAEGISYEEAKRQIDEGEAERYRMTLEEYIARGEQLGVDPSWQEAMVKASSLHHVDRFTEMKTIIRAELQEAKVKQKDDDWMDRIADLAYQHTIYAIETEIRAALGFNQPAIDRMHQIIKNAWAPDGTVFAKRAEVNNDKLAVELEKLLTKACITGQPYSDLAAEMTQKVKLSQYEAERIIRTESTQVSSRAEQAAYQTAGIDQYEILVTLDERTCETCGKWDKHVENVDDMEVGVNAPPFHPNCRCTTIGHYDDGIDETRIAKDENGKNIYVDGDMTWSQWREQYGNRVTESAESGIINEARDLSMFPVTDVPRDNQKIRPNTLFEEMQRTEMGREALHYLEESGVTAAFHFGVAPEGQRATQQGDKITLNIRNLKDDRDAAAAVIHEITHHKYGIGKCQWAEAVCFSQEYKYLHETEAVPVEAKREIIAEVKRAYPELNWKKGGLKYGKPI